MKNPINPKMFGTLYGVDNTMMDTLNTAATDYVIANYENLVKVAGYMDVAPDKVNDIVHDVYMSLHRSEYNGEGYNEDYVEQGEHISVADFVYGRMKKYSMNKKYRKSTLSSTEVSASSSGDEVKDMTTAQLVLHNAQAYDPICDLDEQISVSEEIEALVSFASSTNLNIKFILKNISSLANMEFDIGLLNNLRAFLRNEEYSELFTSVVKYAGKNPTHYRDLVAAI